MLFLTTPLLASPMKTFLTLMMGLAPLAGFAQALTNSGATITVQSGATLYVTGGVQNTAGSTLTNDGTLELTGDLTNAGTLNGTGTLRFSGSTDQQLTPGTGATTGTLALANTGAAGANRLLLKGDLTTTTATTLTTGLVRTDPGATLILPDGASLSGEAAGRYVQGNVRIVRNSVAGPVNFGNGATLDGTGQSLGVVSITRTAGLQTADVSYGQNLGSPTKKGIDRIWTVAATNQPTAPLPLTLSWLADDNNGLTDFSQSRVWQQPAAGQPWGAVGAATNASGLTISAAPASLARFTVSNAANPLPVTLTAFAADRRGADGLLSWRTAQEKNSAYFAVESSADGKTYRELGRVTGQGNSSAAHEYAFTDVNLARYVADLIYYRLRTVDLDGSVAYSPIRTLSVPLEGLVFEVYPTRLPTGQALLGHVRTSESGPATLLITDVLGRPVLRQTLNLTIGSTALELPAASQWAEGLYVVHFQQGSHHLTARVVRE